MERKIGTSRSAAAGGFSIGTVVIDAKSVAEMQNVTDFFTTVRQSARQGGQSLAGVRA